MRNVEDHLAKAGEELPYKAPTPLSSGYRPEIDVSPELGETDASHFHSLVGVLRWIVELGGIYDVFTSCPTSGGTSQGDLPHLCIFKSTFEYRDGV